MKKNEGVVILYSMSALTPTGIYKRTDIWIGHDQWYRRSDTITTILPSMDSYIS